MNPTKDIVLHHTLRIEIAVPSLNAQFYYDFLIQSLSSKVDPIISELGRESSPID